MTPKDSDQAAALPPETRQVFPPGHFYSPIPDLAEVRHREAAIWGEPPPALQGIDLNVQLQLDMLAEFSAFWEAMPFKDRKTEGLRYHFKNDSFGHGDAVALYSMLRHAAPRRVIEVGCGYSSALILDVNERFFDGAIDTTFIDPYPQSLLRLLKKQDRGAIHLLPRPVQDVSPGLFASLERNDVLFIDSSHVAKAGSDVTYLFAHVVPVLAPGVYVHFHDIMYPFEYPKTWVYEGRAWNETYVLRAFLQYNAAFEIVLFTNYLGAVHSGAVTERMPGMLGFQNSSSLWLRRRG